MTFLASFKELLTVIFSSNSSPTLSFLSPLTATVNLHPESSSDALSLSVASEDSFWESDVGLSSLVLGPSSFWGPSELLGASASSLIFSSSELESATASEGESETDFKSSAETTESEESESESATASANSAVETTDIDINTIKTIATIFKIGLLLIWLPPIKKMYF